MISEPNDVFSVNIYVSLCVSICIRLYSAVSLTLQPSTGETQESMNNVSCRRDMTEILLKAE